MPSLITHDFFGRDIYDRLFGTIGGSRDEADAFLLGNQGPDPLFYAVLSPRMRAHRRLGSTMHSKKPTELIKALKDALSILNGAELPIGRAYALGFLCHYALDSTAHPFVYYHEYRLCDAGEPGLSRADGSEVHSLIESELDELLLFTRRGQTVATFDPSAEILKASDFVLHVASKLHVYLALTVYGEIVPKPLFSTSVKDFRAAQRFFHSPSGCKRALIGRLEQIARPFSFYRSMSHRPVELSESAFDNRDHDPWTNPFTDEASLASFQDLYDEALGKAQAAMASFDRDDFGSKAARAITSDLDFSGRPVVAMLVAVEDNAPVRV